MGKDVVTSFCYLFVIVSYHVFLSSLFFVIVFSVAKPVKHSPLVELPCLQYKQALEVQLATRFHSLVSELHHFFKTQGFIITIQKRKRAYHFLKFLVDFQGIQILL